MKNEQETQNQYYIHNADTYDQIHVSNKLGEHEFAMKYMSVFIETYNIKSILDVGTGTGRLIQYIKKKHPNIKVLGVEPCDALREKGYEMGINLDQLINGDGNKLQFEDKTFDLVCEFGMLHHVPKPERIISEMLRVSKVGVFISDSNNFGQGSPLVRKLKQFINLLGIWKLFNYLITKGKVYHLSESDGVFYSYSVFNNIGIIKKACNKIFLMNTKGEGVNLYNGNTHIALFALKN